MASLEIPIDIQCDHDLLEIIKDAARMRFIRDEIKGEFELSEFWPAIRLNLHSQAQEFAFKELCEASSDFNKIIDILRLAKEFNIKDFPIG